MNIIPDKIYSGVEAQKILGIKSRQYLSNYVRERFLLAIMTGSGNGTRYMFLGKNLQEFKKRYDKNITLKRYTNAEVDKAVRETLKGLQ